jgi:hypothetical protein
LGDVPAGIELWRYSQGLACEPPHCAVPASEMGWFALLVLVMYGQSHVMPVNNAVFF